MSAVWCSVHVCCVVDATFAMTAFYLTVAVAALWVWQPYLRSDYLRLIKLFTMKLHPTQLLRHCSGVDFVGDVCVFPHWSTWRIWGCFVCHAEHSMHIMAKGICEERTCVVFARCLDMQIIEMPSYCALPLWCCLYGMQLYHVLVSSKSGMLGVPQTAGHSERPGMSHSCFDDFLVELSVLPPPAGIEHRSRSCLVRDMSQCSATSLWALRPRR